MTETGLAENEIDTAATAEMMITAVERDIMRVTDMMTLAASEGISHLTAKLVCWVGSLVPPASSLLRLVSEPCQLITAVFSARSRARKGKFVISTSVLCSNLHMRLRHDLLLYFHCHQGMWHLQGTSG